MLHVWKRHAYRVVVGKSEGKAVLGKPNHTCEDNIKMYLSETEWQSAD